MNDSIHEFLSNGIHALSILIILSGIGICLLNLAVSRWVKVILCGFIGWLAASTCISLLGYAVTRDLLSWDWPYFQPLYLSLSFLHTFSLGLVILGLGLLLWEYKRCMNPSNM